MIFSDKCVSELLILFICEVVVWIDIKIIDLGIILTTDRTITDQNITNIKIDYAIIHRTEIQVIATDNEITLSQHIGITHVIEIHKKNLEVVHLNIKDKKSDSSNRRNSTRPPGIDNNKSTELQLNHIKSESTDSESDTKTHFQLT